jgi:hypothetical protein
VKFQNLFIFSLVVYFFSLAIIILSPLHRIRFTAYWFFAGSSIIIAGSIIYQIVDIIYQASEK